MSGSDERTPVATEGVPVATDQVPAAAERVPVAAERVPVAAEKLRRRPGFVLAKLAALAQRDCVERLAAIGLHQRGHAILCCLAEFGAESQKEVAARLGFDTGDMVAFVDALERDNLVERQRDEHDRRRQLLLITPAGRKALAHAEKIYDQSAADVFGPLNATETAQLNDLMRRVLAHHQPNQWPA